MSMNRYDIFLFKEGPKIFNFIQIIIMFKLK